LVEKIIDVEEDEDGVEVQGQSGVKAPYSIVSNDDDSEEHNDEDSEGQGRRNEEVRRPDRNVALLTLSGGSSGGSGGVRTTDTPQTPESYCNIVQILKMQI
jgi:hypothetical protein